MIKINTIYSTKDDYYIVVLRHPKAKWYELHRSFWPSNLKNFDYLLKYCDPFFVFYKLSDIRYYARKVIDGEDFS
jgi:hypothetical protein